MLTGADPSTHQPHLDDRAIHARGLEIAIGLVSADDVEHDVDSAGNRRTQFAQPVGGTAFEHCVGAEGTAGVGLTGRARHGNPRADRLGDLDRCGADPRRAGVDEGPTATREAALHHEGIPRGEEHLGNRRGVSRHDR